MKEQGSDSKGLIGRRVEQLAAEWLLNSGFKLLTRNHRSRFGEIDLIGIDAQCLAFIEVRYRVSERFGGAAPSVSASKQRKLCACASDYLRRNPRLGSLPCRFDVLAAHGALENLSLNWIKSAFDSSFY